MQTLRALVLAALPAIASSLVLPASAETWRSYHNARFGTTTDVPMGWSMEPPPANDDGRIFNSPDNKAMIIVSGIRSLDPYETAMTNEAKGSGDETITYTKRGNRWIVVSGVKGEDIFYRRSLLVCRDTIWNHVYISYPKAEKETYDALVAHVSASLRHGPSADCD